MQSKDLTIRQFSTLNVSRALVWHQDGLDSWSPAEWGNALAGEVGELCNVLKKILRHDMGIQQNLGLKYPNDLGNDGPRLLGNKRADLILLNLRNIEEPYLDPEVSIVDAVVHRGRSQDVDTVMVDGEVIMQDRKLTRIDKEGLFEELKGALDRPLTPQELERRDLSRLTEPHLRRFYQGTLPENMTPHTYYNSST